MVTNKSYVAVVAHGMVNIQKKYDKIVVVDEENLGMLPRGEIHIDFYGFKDIPFLDQIPEWRKM